jgi:hypothetical protein
MKYQHVTCQYNILKKYLINVPQKPAPRLLTQRGQEAKAEKGDERMRGQRQAVSVTTEVRAVAFAQNETLGIQYCVS